MGIVFSLIFHLGTNERKYDSPTEDAKASTSSFTYPPIYRMEWNDWLKEHQFYQVNDIGPVKGGQC